MNLPSWAAYAVAAAAILGHFGLHLAAYNRINATGLRRGVVKRVVKLLLLSCLLLPLLAMFTETDHLAAALRGELTGYDLAALHGLWRAYGLLCLTAVALLGIPWLLWRPILRLEAVDANREVEVYDLSEQCSQPLALTTKCRRAARIPGNQILEMSVDKIELPVVGLPAPLDGYRLAHLSDLHLTGHFSPAMIAWAVQQINRWSPDLIALTGDIIDRAECIAWLNEALGHAVAKDGCYFILGNHDRNVPEPERIRTAMSELGWQDVGGKCVTVNLQAAAGGPEAEHVAVQILGNERPWFTAPSAEQVQSTPAGFRLLLSHSPDQLDWARRHGVQLMLAGHTHGGQGRLPLAGPLLSPSWHGSRFASGDFYKAPTTLHVSRGISGAHLLRINCRPELSLLTLRTASA